MRWRVLLRDWLARTPIAVPERACLARYTWPMVASSRNPALVRRSSGASSPASPWAIGLHPLYIKMANCSLQYGLPPFRVKLCTKPAHVVSL